MFLAKSKKCYQILLKKKKPIVCFDNSGSEQGIILYLIYLLSKSHKFDQSNRVARNGQYLLAHPVISYSPTNLFGNPEIKHEGL